MAKKKPLNPKDALEVMVDGFFVTAARGDIRIGRWPAQGVERRLNSLELMIEGREDPNIKAHKKEYVDVAPGKVRIKTSYDSSPFKNLLRRATEADIGNLKVGISNCRELLDDLRVLLKPKDPPHGWLEANAAAHAEKVREKLAEIDEVIQDLSYIEDRIPQRAARKAVSAGGKARAESERKKTKKRDEWIIEQHKKGQTDAQISRALKHHKDEEIRSDISRSMVNRIRNKAWR